MSILDIKTTTKLRKKTLICSSSFVEKVEKISEWTMSNPDLDGSIDWNHYIQPIIEKKIEQHRKLMMMDPPIVHDVYLSVALMKMIKEYDVECKEKGLSRIDWNHFLVDEYLRVASKIEKLFENGSVQYSRSVSDSEQEDGVTAESKSWS